MASPLLARLEARLAATADPRDAACLRAERTLLLAREGRLDAARHELAALHAHHGGRADAVVSAWLHLADGLVQHCGGSRPAARDKLRRAMALGSAAGAPHVQALSAAWLAQLACLDEDFASAARLLSRALATAGRDDHAARSRACLVAAQAWHWAGRLDLALPWYRRARLHATDEGDQATLAGLMHDMAWLRALQARRASLAGASCVDEARTVLAGTESVGHFGERIGMAALLASVRQLRAHALAMLERYGEAAPLFAAHLETAAADEPGRPDGLRSAALADLAWCRVNTGDPAEASALALAAQDDLHDGLCQHQRAFVHGRLAQVHARLGHTAAVTHAERAAAAWHAHAGAQDRTGRLLNEALSPVAVDQA